MEQFLVRCQLLRAMIKKVLLRIQHLVQWQELEQSCLRGGQTIKGQAALGGTANIFAQGYANEMREANGKDTSDINWINAAAASMIGAAGAKVQSYGVPGTSSSVVLPGMTLNAISSGNTPEKPLKKDVVKPSVVVVKPKSTTTEKLSNRLR